MRSQVCSAVASLTATACYNYYFLPPIGTFTVADPANWVALAVFLLTSVLVSRLVARKGQDVLIRGMHDVRKRVPDATLVLVGGGQHDGGS